MSVSITPTVLKKSNASKAVRQQRTFDYLYDPVYTVSSEVDHVKSSLKAYATQDRLKKVPEFGCMFSNLPHYPRFTVQLDPTDPVPASIQRRWRGHAERRREALHLLPRGSSGVALWPKQDDIQVTGADRWKYFKRPLIPFAQQPPTGVVFALPAEDFALFSVEKNATQQPTHSTVGVQTDYRESEAQTDPYSPEYVIQPGSSPSELLSLAALTWGHGLPAGLAEVELIARTRAKRAWEASLPPLDDLSQLGRRRHLMEQMEAEEWAFREGEIQSLQEARLAVLKDLLQQRDQAQKDATSKRLNQRNLKLQKDKEVKLHKMQDEYMMSVRKLEAKRRKEDIRLQRIGYYPSPKHVSVIPRDVLTSSNISMDKLKRTCEGLLEIHAGVTASVLKTNVKQPKCKDSKDVIKPSDRAIQLWQQYKALREDEMAKRPLKALIKKQQPVRRPITPTADQPPEGDEEMELAVIHLQKLLRGRSVQDEVFKAAKNHLDLIQEVRTFHALTREEQELQKAEQGFVMTLKKQRDKQRHEAAQEEASQARAVGKELQHLFDTLSKELIRLQEERRIHAFMLLAERRRRLREAEESGRRQTEDQRRREEEEVFRQLVQVNQETVDLYLEDIILETMEQTADQQARDEIHMMAKEINDIAYAMEEGQNSLQSEEIVSELVYSFLIPEIEKISFRKKVHQRQHRHWQAACSIIQDTAEYSGVTSSLEASQWRSPSQTASNQVLEGILQVEQEQEQAVKQHHTKAD